MKSDQDTPIAELRERWAQFVREREWDQYHSPKNLAMALSVEAAELMEHFLWIDNEESRRVVQDPRRLEQVADEIADVAGVIFALCNSLGLDLATIVRNKMARNEQKYPVERIRGKYRLEE